MSTENKNDTENYIKMSDISKFRKKQIIVEARILSFENSKDIKIWCNGKDWISPPMTHVTGITIPTLEGGINAFFGDYIIKGIQGEFYTCRAGIFKQTHEAVEMATETIIKEKDLVIGRWFLGYDNNPFQWSLADFDSMITAKVEIDEIIKSGIKLTEDILLKCGFEEIYKSEIQSTYYIDGLSYYFWYKYENNYADCKGLKIKCDNLHQLQNLYFALTGEELNINL